MDEIAVDVASTVEMTLALMNVAVVVAVVVLLV